MLAAPHIFVTMRRAKVKTTIPKPVYTDEVKQLIQAAGRAMRQYQRINTNQNYQRYVEQLKLLSVATSLDLHQATQLVNNHFRIKQ